MSGYFEKQSSVYLRARSISREIENRMARARDGGNKDVCVGEGDNNDDDGARKICLA